MKIEGRQDGRTRLTGSSYRVTLNHNEKIVSEEEQTKMLKDCHQRCADRTLRVLEKNGSIFIKLGQHLVDNTSFNG
jgi:aarF domain-containing kinase